MCGCGGYNKRGEGAALMDEQRVRISDIAQELGLSTATVSNVIHGKAGKVSDATARRVQALLEEKGYIPSMAGLLLAQNASRIIGVFVNDHDKYEGQALSDAFIASTLNALCTHIEAAGQFMMVKKARRAEEVLQFASMWNMDGLVVIGFCRQDYAYLRSHMRIPFVVYDGECEPPERFVNLTVDNFDGGRQVGALMQQLGYTQAVCVADNDTGVDRARMDGFCAGFGSGYVQRLIAPLHRDERAAFYRRHLDTLRAAGAVFAVSDCYVVEVMRFLQDAGLNVPGDVSVAGFDDVPLCSLMRPALTTVHQDSEQRARIAVERLSALRAGQDVGGTVMLPVTLIQRESTAPRR